MASASDSNSLTTTQAVARYQISKAQLVRLLTSGELHGQKVKGTRVLEWRVEAQALEQLGYVPRQPLTLVEPRRVVDLARAVPDETVQCDLASRLRAAEMKAAELDSRLGHAMLTVGALRRQLLDAGLTPVVFGADLEHFPC